MVEAYRRYVGEDGHEVRARRASPDEWRVIDSRFEEPYRYTAADFPQMLRRADLHEIALHEVDSSNLAAVGYDPVTWDLLIRFVGGRVYHYRDVPPGVAGPLLGSPRSLGGYFQSAIKPYPDLYPFTRLDEPLPAAHAAAAAHAEYVERTAGQVLPPPGGVFYVLVCIECDDDLSIPFPSAEERGVWASEHTRGTGHARWFVTEVES